MPDNIVFSFSTDDKDVTKAFQNLVKENAKLRGEVQTGVTEAKAAAKQEQEWQKLREKATKEAVSQMQQMNSAAQRIKESISTPFQEAKKKTSELRDHLAAGTLTLEDYRKAYANVAKELREATRDHAAESAATKAASEFKTEAARRTAKLREQVEQLAAATQQAGTSETAVTAARSAALSALIAKQQQLATAIDQVTQEFKDGKITGEQYKKTFDELSTESTDLTGKLKQLDAQVKEDSDDMKRAGTIVKDTESKTDRYGKAVAELDRLKAKGILTSKQYADSMKAAKKELEGGGTATGTFTDSLGKMATVGVGAVAFLQQMAGKIKELQSEMVASTVTFDRLSRKLGIQGGLSDEERKVQSQAVGRVALDAGVGLDKAFETATQLSSSGFEDPVKGGTLNTALALMQSSNKIDGNAADFIKGSGQFMTAFGMKKNEANLTDLGVRLQGLFKTTDVQASDLPEFAKAAPVLSGAGMNIEQALSTLTALRETMNPGEAATGARNVVSLLQTASANKTASGALASVGLRPEQVDIQGEGLTASLETLKAATGHMGEAEKATLMTQIFGRENTPAASILMNSTGKFADYARMQRSAGTSFEADVATARSGIAANTARAEVSKTMDTVKHEDVTTEQEQMRLARVSLRERLQKDKLASGGIKGRIDSAVIGLGGVIDDNVVYPLAGESVLGAGHVSEMRRLNGGRDPRKGVITLPDALRNPQDVIGNGGIDALQAAMIANNALLQKQLDIAAEAKAAADDAIKDKRKERQEQKRQQKEELDSRKQAAHAGIVGARGANQREGAP